jgi:hypothetical protein
MSTQPLADAADLAIAAVDTQADHLEVRTRIHGLCMSVDGFLRNNRFPRDFVDVFRAPDGHTMDPHEARAFLRLELHKGHKVIPCSAECGNPCQHADRGCTGFDYAGKGCPGRESDNA